MKSMLAEAAVLASTGTENRNYHLGCIAKRTDGVFVKSTNERTKIPDPNAHAEARVLRKADYGCTLWVARIKADGSWVLAKPCSSCRALIKARGVYKVFYTIGPNEYGVWYPQKEKI